jgi:hypothetical protein
MTRAPPHASRAVRQYGFGHLRSSQPWRATSQAGSQMSKVCVPGGQVPLRTLLLTSRYLSEQRKRGFQSVGYLVVTPFKARHIASGRQRTASNDKSELQRNRSRRRTFRT